MTDNLNFHVLQSFGFSINSTMKWAMAKFGSVKSLQKFATIHASIHNHFNQVRHLYCRKNFKDNRSAALAEWRQIAA